MGKTLLIGNFGSGNVGDEMILCATLEKFAREKDGEGASRGIVVMTADEEWTRNFVGVDEEGKGDRLKVKGREIEFVPFFPTGGRSAGAWLLSGKYRKQLLNLKESVDTVVFCGGGLFAIKFQACWIWSTVFWWCKRTFPKAQIRLEHQGVDQKLSKTSKRLTEKVFASADYISVRDEGSKKVIRSLGIRKRIEVVGDCVEEWLSERKKEEGKRKKGTGERDKKILLLNSVSSFDQIFYSRIQKKFKHYSFKFVLMDPLDQQWVPTGFRGDVVILRSQEEVFEMFGNADMAIGERLHFLILAQYFLGSKKTKMLKKPYSEKTEHFGKKYGIEEFGE